MTVSELLETLKSLVDEGYGDSILIKSSDSEGNTYSTVECLSSSWTCSENDYAPVEENEWAEWDELENAIYIW